MEEQIQAAGEQAMREALKQAIRQWEEHRGGLPPLWSQAALPGRNRAPEHRDDVRTGANTPPALLLPDLWAALVSGQPIVLELARGTISSPLREAAMLAGCS